MNAISEGEVRTILGYPDGASDRELAEIVARRAGFDRPANEASVWYLARVVTCLRPGLLTRPDEAIDSAEAANSHLGHILGEGISSEAYGLCAEDLGDAQWTGTLQEFIAVELVPKLGHAGLLNLYPKSPYPER